MLRLLGRVPHRFFFLLGAVQAVAVMAWWLLDLGARYAGLYAPIAWTVPPPWGHALLLTYTVFPFFMFGFLMTAMPNWTGEAMPHRAHLYAGLPMALGVVLLYVGFAAGRAGALGLAPLHALTIGYFAATTVAMVSRVSLGHSGRALEADALTWWAFIGLLATARGRADEHAPHADNPRVAARPIASLTRVLAALCGAAALSAAAQEWRYDGTELARFAADYEKLRDAGGGTLDPSLSARVGYFTGFVLGVARANADRGWYCLPESLQAGQVWDAVARFLRDYPGLAQAKPSTLVNGALAKSFPCSAAERAARKPAETTRPKPKAQAKPAS